MHYFNGICLFFRHFPSLKKLKPPYLTKYLADKMALFIFPGWSIFSPTKRCKRGVNQAFHTLGTAYLSHSWRYSQILPWQTNNTFIKMLILKCTVLPRFAPIYPACFRGVYYRYFIAPSDTYFPLLEPDTQSKSTYHFVIDAFTLYLSFNCLSISLPPYIIRMILTAALVSSGR